MASTAKSTGSTALDSVKTQQKVGAGLEQKAAHAKKQKASQPEGADPTHDSPKRHGEKLEQARDAAAGRSKG